MGMTTKQLVQQWFDIWTRGNFKDLPLAEDFSHTSPYGTIESKEAYMEIIESNREKFLDHQFEIHDTLFDTEKACIRYTAIQDKFRLEVSEWHYIKNDLIQSIVAYYDIDEKRIELE